MLTAPCRSDLNTCGGMKYPKETTTPRSNAKDEGGASRGKDGGAHCRRSRLQCENDRDSWQPLAPAAVGPPHSMPVRVQLP